MHELTGNDAEAEVLVRTGKEISHFHKLPVFRIAFTSLLGMISHFIGLPIFCVVHLVSHYLDFFRSTVP